MPDTPIVASFAALLQVLGPCFTNPSFRSFHVLMCGWVLNLGRHTVTGVVRAAVAVGAKHISSFHRFFSRGRWTTDDVGLVLARVVVATLVPGGPVHVLVDDTLGRHTGKRIAGASMHRDPLLSTAKRPFFHWGHVWVVVAIEVELFGKRWALPVLMRLHRSRKRCEAEGRDYRKTTEHARALIALLAKQFSDRSLIVVGDAAYTNSSVIKSRPANVTVVGRGRLDAALYAPPPRLRPGQKGRPRVRGAKLACPARRAAQPRAPWRNVEVHVYGKRVTVRVLVIDALWYIVGGGERMRLVVVRDFPGHERDDVFASTDPAMSASCIIETFALRWSLEVTFHETKGKLGLEDPQNRTERAVERTAPMALVAYTLVVLWYQQSGHQSLAARLPCMPWYAAKAGVTFTDMIATLRRASWRERLFDPDANVAVLRKRLQPLVDYVSSAA